MGWRNKNTISIWDPHTHSEHVQGLDARVSLTQNFEEKENVFMNMELGFRLQFVSVWAKGKRYYSNIFMLWGQECILVSPSSCTHTAGSQLYTCSPALEVKAGAGLYLSSHSHSTQKLHFCPTGRETNASQTSPAFCYPEASVLFLTRNILTFPGTKIHFCKTQSTTILFSL